MQDQSTKIAVASFSQRDVKAVRLAQPWAVFDLERREIPWVFSTDELDHAGERIDQRGLDLRTFKAAPRLLWSHELSRPAIGSVPKIQGNVKLEDGRRALVGLTRFATRDEHPFADQIFALASPVGPNGKARTPHINSTSVGVANTEREFPESQEEAARMGLPPSGNWIRRGTLVEVSAVNVGMNPGALQPVLKAWQGAGVGRDDDIDRFLGWEGLSAQAAEKALQGRLRAFVDMGAGRPPLHGFELQECAVSLAEALAPFGVEDQSDGGATPTDAEPTEAQPSTGPPSGIEQAEAPAVALSGWRAELAQACEESAGVEAEAFDQIEIKAPQTEGFALGREFSAALAKQVDREMLSARAAGITTKDFDVERQHLEAAALEHDWVSRYCNCEVKQLHRIGTTVDPLDAGSFLRGLGEALGGWESVDRRQITYHGKESPPGYETIELGPGESESFMVDGLDFMRGAVPLVVKAETEWWGGYSFGIWSRREDTAAAEQVLADAWEWAETNHYRRGEAFALTGAFLPKTADSWSGLFLEPENTDVVSKAIANINAKGAGMANRGMIWQGPPGTGKTLTARVVRNQAEGTFIWCSARDFMRTGGTRGLMRAFDMARRFAPAVILLEDIDGWLGRSALDLLKTEMDGMGQSTGVTTILTTNHPEALPKALIDRPGRFHDVLTFDLPTPAIRQAMISKWLPGLDESATLSAVKESAGMSGAHVFELCAFAKTLEEQDGDERAAAMEKAIAKVKRQRAAIGVGRQKKGAAPESLGACNFSFEDTPCGYVEPLTVSEPPFTIRTVSTEPIPFGGYPNGTTLSIETDASREQRMRDALSDTATANARVAEALGDLAEAIKTITTRGGGAGAGSTERAPEGDLSQPGVGDDDTERLATVLSHALLNLRAEDGAGRIR